jgi:membrane-bound lytic murein transglycosylase D
MKIVKRVANLALIALGMFTTYTAGGAPTVAMQEEQEQQVPELDYETDTTGLATDLLPEIETPGNLVPGDLIQERFARLQKKIPLVYHKVSHQFVEYFIYTKPEFTRRMMEQKNLYFPIYEKALAKHNMPDELKYLSMIESGLNPKIISYAGAGGLWQFMRATGREFGLRQDAYVDERFDPEKSTEAACRYLRQLYTIFGDWEMALASYNAGPGNVKRAMRRSGGNTFWSVYDALPKQTRGYVPQFVAILYMMHYGQDHGIVPQNTEFPTIADTIQVNGYLNLQTFASLSGVTMEEIQKLNPQIINTVLPDYTRNFILKVPAQKFAIMQPNRLAILDSASKRATSGIMLASLDDEADGNYVSKRLTHTVRGGETLSSVANRYGVSISEVKRWNRMRSTKLLRGQRLTIIRQVRVAPRPVSKPETEEKIILAKSTTTETTKTTEEASAELVAQTEEREGEDAEEATKMTKPKAVAKAVTYVVRRGDNLTAIGHRYRVSVDELKEWNELENGSLQPGQKLLVSNPVKAVASKPGQAIAATSQKASSQIKPRYHTVQRGDTLWTISQRYGLTIDKIKHANKMKSNSIRAGMKLLITG